MKSLIVAVTLLSAVYAQTGRPGQPGYIWGQCKPSWNTLLSSFWWPSRYYRSVPDYGDIGGGFSYTGPTVCIDSYCYAINQYFSQCLPLTTTAAAPTTSTTAL